MEKSSSAIRYRQHEVIQMLSAVIAVSALIVSVYSQISNQMLQKEVETLKSRVDQLEVTVNQMLPVSFFPIGHDIKKRSVGINLPSNESQLFLDTLLQQMNVTIAHGLLSILQYNSKKLQELEEVLQKNETMPTSLPDEHQLVGAGSSYIRWGKQSCNNSTEEIFTGWVAGQSYTHTGGSSVYTCLPSKPEYQSNMLNSHLSNWIFDTNYDTFYKQRDRNVPCARCYVPTRSTTIMIPATLTCPPSWTKEYDGYLMSGLYYHKRAYDYVCVDKDMETLDCPQTNRNGAIMYFVKASCRDSVHCPPYHSGAELACVVCSK
ncbi:uncharacterized protein [Watersipora subatra]|uniref:uncharacterized protein n=1 Tax=Watersipora subatra TaxID=2589382 RepID=UPI00355B339E